MPNESKEERLARALRDNLRRRKAASRKTSPSALPAAQPVDKPDPEG